MQSLFALSGGDVRRSFPGSVGTGRFRAGGTYALLYCWRCRRSGPELLLCPGGAACFPDGRGNFYGWHGPGAGFDAGADPQRGLSFVTHSHRDHTGAIHFLEENGFTGQVLMSNQTYRQIHHKPLNTMILDSTAPELELSTDFRVIWGRTGHCAGAVWFLIEIEGKKLFFSGDYREGDPFYRCDEVRGMKADLAVVDAAYSREDRGSEMREEVMKTVEEMVKDNHPLLLPVPHYGRGLSIAVLIHQRLGDAHPVYMSPKLYDEWLNLAHRKYFARDAVLDMPYSVFKAWDEEHVEEGGIYLLTDAQLAKSYSRHLADENPDMGILLTGSVHGYGRAGEYLSEGRAKFTLWPNHLTRREMQDFKESNYFSIVVPFHNPKEEADADTFIF